MSKPWSAVFASNPWWKRKLVLGINLLAPFLFIGLWIIGEFWIGLGIMFLSHMLLLFATLVPNSQLLGPVITRFEPEGDEIWLTIDDGPDPVDTPQLLDLLDAAGAKATFFLIGDKVTRHPELVRDIVQRGHGVGNHTASHPAFSFWRLGPVRIKEEVREGSAALVAAGVDRGTGLFRAPAGLKNPFVHPVLKKAGLRLVGWSARGLDGRYSDGVAILERLEDKMEPGAILVMHEGREIEQKRKRLSVKVLEGLLEIAERKGLKLVVPDAAALREI